MTRASSLRWALSATLAAGCVNEVRLYIVDAGIDRPVVVDRPTDPVDRPTDPGDAATTPDAATKDADVEILPDLPPGPTAACRAGSTFVGLVRECGWQNGGFFTCEPGAQVTLGCGVTCTPALGRCSGDTILRVCEGVAFCSQGEAIAQNDDDGCMPVSGRASLCSRAVFLCPTSGRFTALVGPLRTDETARCVLGALNAR